VMLCAAELWNILTFGMARGAASPPVPSDGVTVVKPSEVSDSSLANQALLLVHVLANHCTGDKNLHNPYRQALFSFSNSQGMEVHFVACQSQSGVVVCMPLPSSMVRF
jgi:hypothetical protein